MPLVDSLLTAVVRSDGDALVLHVGEKPYVVAAGGPVELSRQGLGLGAMEGMLAQLLSADALRALREMGAVEHELDDRPSSHGDRFTVVAARGGDDIWIELRRHRRMRQAATAVAAAEPVAAAPAMAVPAVAMPAAVAGPAPAVMQTPAVMPAPAAPIVTVMPSSRMEPSVTVTTPTPVSAPAFTHVPAAAAAAAPAIETPVQAAPALVVAAVAPVLSAARVSAPPADAHHAPVHEMPAEMAHAAAIHAPVPSAPETPGHMAEADHAALHEIPAAAAERILAAPVAAAEPIEFAHAVAVVPEPVVPEPVEMPMPVVTMPAPVSHLTVEAVEPPAAMPELTPASAMSPVPMPEFAPLPRVSTPPVAPDAVAQLHAEPVMTVPAPVTAVAAPMVSPAAPVAASVSTPASAPLAASAIEKHDEPPVAETPAAPVAHARDLTDVQTPDVAEYEPVFDEFAAAAAPMAETRHDEAAPLPIDVPAPVTLSSPAHMSAVEPRVAYRHEPATVARTAAPLSSRYEPQAPESVHYAPAEPQPTLPGLAASTFGDHSHESTRVESPDALPAVVLSLTRDSARSSGGAARGTVRPGGIERLLRLAAARGASALYLTTQARPAVRVDGDIRLLEGEPALSSGDVEAAVLELAPEGARDKESAEWIRDLADVGRVRITTFRDYRGPGALLRMISARATSAEQLGLVREIQALATEPEGLVIVTGPRASGKSTMVSAFVDLINRQRNDYVITLEGQIRLVHESRGSLISQREVRGSAADIVAAARTAMRENPDVLVIEDLRSPDVLQAALDAAGSGLLVFVSVTAASATAALERLVDLCPSEQRRNVRAALAEHLRGVVAQVLLRKAGGGRLAARELVLNTNAVAALVSDGQIAQLPRAIDSGRKLGMAPLNDALVAFVQSGAVDVREAYRKADDKAGLLALLRREGIDTSFVERLA